MNKLYYDYILPPRKIRLKSKSLNIDTTIEQGNWDSEEINNIKCDIISVDDLFNLAKTGLFTEISYLIDKDMTTYYRPQNCPYQRIQLKGWINILDYIQGGNWTEDNMRWI